MSRDFRRTYPLFIGTTTNFVSTSSPSAIQKGRFFQRTSKHQAKDLIALCVWLSQKVASTSLTQLCSCLESSTGVLISPEGLNQRFNPSAVRLLQHVLTSLLTQKLYTSRLFLIVTLLSFSVYESWILRPFNSQIYLPQRIKNLEAVAIQLA